MRNKKRRAATILKVVIMLLLSILSTMLFVEVVDMPSEGVCADEQREAD